MFAIAAAVPAAGCDLAPTSSLGSAVSAPACQAPAGRTTLYDGQSEGPVSGLFVSGGQVLFSTTYGLWSVPLAGGAPVEIAAGATGVGVVGGTLYYTASHAVGAPGADGRQSSSVALYAAPFTGGPIDAGAAALVQDDFTAGASAQDGTSLYVVGPGLGSILRLTPPATAPTSLSLDATLEVRALAVEGGFLYAAVGDLSTSPSAGLIVRIPKAGGALERLTAPAGFPDGLAADASGLIWIQQPPVGTFGNSSIVRADLAGRGVTTLVDGSAGSPSALGLGGSSLYLLTDVLARISERGGPVEALTAALTSAGMLQVSGSDVVWVDNASRALSSTAPTTVEVLCAAPPAHP
ncbi:MAG TPA: hypothetical protein VHO06_26065 [Polyangia bacterium]|nr:hypothetical protein [Polyangia bacterium]